MSSKTTRRSPCSRNDHHRRQKKKHLNFQQKQKQEEEQQLKVRVVAPATLPENYTFDVLLDDETYTVTVPPGGVKKGYEFEVNFEDLVKRSPVQQQKTYVHEDDNEDDDSNSRIVEDQEEEEDVTVFAQSISGQDEEQQQQQQQLPECDDDVDNDYQTIMTLGDGAPPYGRWRRHQCSCCDVVTQATFWMAFCLTPVLIAQLLTRLGLDWKGRPADTAHEASLSFNRIVLAFLGVLVICNVLPAVGFLMVLLYIFTVLVCVGKNVRQSLRRRYKIPSGMCRWMNDSLVDGLCMCCCGCCSVVQMARHTHDDKEYPGYCCTNTGLELDAPKVV